MTTAAAQDFNLESPEPGKVPDAVVSELRRLRKVATEASGDFRDAVKTQAEKYGVKAGALARYVRALESDSIEEVESEMLDLERLIG